MSEARQLIIFLLCIATVLISFWTLSETINLRLAVERVIQEQTND